MTNLRSELIATGALSPSQPSDVTPVRGSHGAVLRLDVAGRAVALTHARVAFAVGVPDQPPLLTRLRSSRKTRA
jgi:hypothetical protein